MKRLIALLTIIALTLTFVACSSNSNSDNTTAQSKEETSAQPNETKENTLAKDDAVSGKSLVVYFSQTGNTKGVADKIAAVTGADTYEILAAQPYSDDDLNSITMTTAVPLKSKTIKLYVPRSGVKRSI